MPLTEADGLTLASALTTLTDLPAFPTSSVDGYAGRGTRAVAARRSGARRLGRPDRSADGDAVEIATGAMVPDGTDADRADRGRRHLDRRPGRRRRPARCRSGATRATRRPRARSCSRPASPVTPGLIGLAAACGYDTLSVVPAVPTAAGRSSATNCSPPGRPAAGGCATRSARRCRAGCVASARTPVARRLDPRVGPVEDTLDAHVDGHPRRAGPGRPGLHHRRHDARPGRPPAPGAGRARRPLRGQHRGRTAGLPDAAGRDPRRRRPAGSWPACPATRSRRSSP